VVCNPIRKVGQVPYHNVAALQGDLLGIRSSPASAWFPACLHQGETARIQSTSRHLCLCSRHGPFAIMSTQSRSDDLISTPVLRLPHLSPIDRSRLLVPPCDCVRVGPFGPFSPQEWDVVGVSASLGTMPLIAVPTLTYRARIDLCFSVYPSSFSFHPARLSLFLSSSSRVRFLDIPSCSRTARAVTLASEVSTVSPGTRLTPRLSQ
jgi:hypothetical protein